MTQTAKKTMQYVRQHGIVRPRDIEAIGVPREYLLRLHRQRRRNRIRLQAIQGGAILVALRRHDLIASGERAVYATWGFVVVASLGLWTALLQHDFTLRYVASYTSSNLPRLYTLSAFWAGQAGSMLFWSLILTTYSAIAGEPSAIVTSKPASSKKPFAIAT